MSQSYENDDTLVSLTFSRNPGTKPHQNTYKTFKLLRYYVFFAPPRKYIFTIAQIMLQTAAVVDITPTRMVQFI